MRRAGCGFLRIGIESGSPRILRLYNRRMDLQAAEDLVKTCHAEGIRVSIDWMVGFPGETDEDFEQTLALAKRLLPYTCGPKFRPASICRAAPGSDMWSKPDLHQSPWTRQALSQHNNLPIGAIELQRRAILNGTIEDYWSERR